MSDKELLDKIISLTEDVVKLKMENERLKVELKHEQELNPVGAKDSELIDVTNGVLARYYIPKGFHAEIIGDEVHIKQGEQKSAKNIIEIWKDMQLEVYQQASGNRHEPNYSDNSTKMFSLNDIDEIIEKMSEQILQDKFTLEVIKEEKGDNAHKIEPKDYHNIDPHFGKLID